MVMQVNAVARTYRGVTIAAKLAFRPVSKMGSGYADNLGARYLGRTLSLFVKLLGVHSTAAKRLRHAAV